jgi:hypothetical protein
MPIAAAFISPSALSETVVSGLGRAGRCQVWQGRNFLFVISIASVALHSNSPPGIPWAIIFYHCVRRTSLNRHCDRSPFASSFPSLTRARMRVSTAAMSAVLLWCSETKAMIFATFCHRLLADERIKESNIFLAALFARPFCPIRYHVPVLLPPQSSETWPMMHSETLLPIPR